ncbi:S-layer homology domain-containing protein [Paenibacillus planticolens]|nr:S-layer homology domain-containing protein [Paenibacillus planticolens]
MQTRLSVFGIAMLCAASIGYDVMGSSAQSLIRFKDTTQHWAEPSILTAVEKKYVDGYEDGTFKPDSPISRAEFIKMVALATGEKVNQVGGDGWFQPYVDRLKAQEIIPAEFPERYNEPLQRYEMSILSVRSVDKSLKGTMVDSTKLGLIHGVSSTDLDVYGTSTRAQAITIIERILAARKGEKLPGDKYAASAAEIAATGSNVGTMLGLKAQNIGNTWSAGQGATVKLEQVIIADPSDEYDPFMAYIDTSHWNSRVDKQRDFVVMAKFTVQVDETADDSFNLGGYQYLTLYDGTGPLHVSNEALPRVIRFAVPGIYTGFVSYGARRDLAKTGIGFDLVSNKVVVAIP